MALVLTLTCDLNIDSSLYPRCPGEQLLNLLEVLNYNYSCTSPIASICASEYPLSLMLRGSPNATPIQTA